MATAAYIYGVRDVRVEAFQEKKTGDDFTSVDIESVGICGSDLHYYKDGGIGAARITEPFVPGHEFSARLREDIPSRNLVRDQLVAIDPASPCHQCEWCHRGYHNLCPNVVFLGGPPNHGALTQSMQVPIENIVSLPIGMTADQGAMLEPLGVCIHAMDLAKPRLGESVAILGCGPIGLGLLQLVRQMGVGEIHAVDPQPHRAALAKSLGATTAGDSINSIIDATSGRGCDLLLEATNSPAAFRDACLAAAIGGRVLLVGIPDGDQYSLSAAEARRRGLVVKFARRMGNVYPRAIELVANNKVDVDSLISHRFNLDETATAFELQANEEPGLIKSIVYPAQEPNNSA